MNDPTPDTRMGLSVKITRPVVRYHGSKYRIADWIVQFFPPHQCYVEPFGGSGAVLLRKPRAHAEVYNDRDDQAVRLFRVLRDPATAADLVRRLELTPFARSELYAAYEPTDDPVEEARRYIVRAFQGMGADSATRRHRTGFRHKRSVTSQNGWPSREWANYPDSLEAVVHRLRGVCIENDDWRAIIDRYDSPATLFYLDPPYMHEVRTMRHAYNHELTNDDHRELLEQATQRAGMFLISGYATPLYEEMLAGWRRLELPTFAERGQARTEVLWIKPNAEAGQADLFRA